MPQIAHLWAVPFGMAVHKLSFIKERMGAGAKPSGPRRCARKSVVLPQNFIASVPNGSLRVKSHRNEASKQRVAKQAQAVGSRAP